jgi:predicted GNAT family acetyltransferase
MADHDVRHDREMTTFTIELDGAEAVLMYRRVGEDTLDFIETFVPPQHRGRGVAASLAHTAFEYARENGYRVIPTCPYIGTYLKRHPEYRDLVASR